MCKRKFWKIIWCCHLYDFLNENTDKKLKYSVILYKIRTDNMKIYLYKKINALHKVVTICIIVGESGTENVLWTERPYHR